MDDKSPTFDPAAFLDEQRKDTALQLSALGDRVARGELAGVWAVALPREGDEEIVGLVEDRHSDVGRLLQEAHGLVFMSPIEVTSISELCTPGYKASSACLRPIGQCDSSTEEPIADKNLSFSSALVAAKAGLTIRREGWNGAGLNVRLYRPRPGRDEATTVPLLVIINPPTHPTAPNLRASWVPSQTDLLAEDWLVVPGVIYA